MLVALEAVAFTVDKTVFLRKGKTFRFVGSVIQEAVTQNNPLRKTNLKISRNTLETVCDRAERNRLPHNRFL